MQIGMASIDENGKAHGGKAGDQTGREVKICNWYKYSKGWDCILRAKSRNKAHSMAINMRQACENNNIGYDQWERESLLNQVKKVGYDMTKVVTPTETDCSALVATIIVCCGTEERFMRNPSRNNALAYTGDLKKLCLATGEFDVLTESKYLNSGDYLLEGDIILNEGNHVAMAIENGSKAVASTPTSEVKTTTSSSVLKKGSKGDEVKTLQSNLNKVMNSGLVVDGDFGNATYNALVKFQKKYGLEADGIYGPASKSKMDSVLAASAQSSGKAGTVAASRLNVRNTPNGTVVKVINRGTKVTVYEEKNGWGRIGDNQWVSLTYISF